MQLQKILNLVCTFGIPNNCFYEERLWAGILESTDFAMLQSTSGQLVFRRDIILNTPFIDDWEANRQFNQQLIDKNNQIENKNCKSHTYTDYTINY